MKRPLIVVKIGTAVLSKGSRIDEGAVKSIADQVSDLVEENSFVLVSSGAILGGITLLNLDKTPSELSLREKQVCASIGQPYLMSLYGKYFSRRGVQTAQILLTEDDLANKVSYRNVWRTLNALLKLGAVPIINENDAVSVKELLPLNPYVPDSVRFGDNDRLSAIVASRLKASLLLILSDVDGYYEFGEDGSKRLVEEIREINRGMLRAVRGGGRLGKGGMRTKLEAAKIASEAGIPTVIANGKRPSVIKDVLAGKRIGTRILPKRR